MMHFQLNTKCALTALLLASNTFLLSAQTGITTVYTDYGGSLWQSSTTSINSNHPDNNQNLIGFTYAGTTYSTGVNNAMLTLNGITHTNIDVAAFEIPSNSIIASGNGSYIGLGLNSTDVAVNDIPQYLTDGTNGLNIGTGIFNIPAARITYAVSGFNTGAVGDGVPDVILTQIGDPPSSTPDKLWFTNSNGDIVGDTIVGSVGAIPVVAQQDWKFYTPTTPPVLTSVGGPTRDLRVVGFDLEDFGLTTLNLVTITNFVHSVSGQSDQAFLAHNTASFISGGGNVLPVNLKSFSAVALNHSARLTWVATDARNFSHFELERSPDSKTFAKIADIKVNAVYGDISYSYTDEDVKEGGAYFYRLKMVDNDLSAIYSKVVRLDFAATRNMQAYPNPVSDFLKISAVADLKAATLYSMDGKQIDVSLSDLKKNNGIDVSSLSAGFYLIRLIADSGTEQSLKFQVSR